ncbi:carbohydrate-binding family 9-like protein [Pedobacter hartonius]|uniref:Carbohydrate-binding family 9 n=1 Tax=Pedobacter hartonius TaxID=425514 RepID=A0A1H4DST8_9SPHI|nr:carbohydrate-binding family 9-like protein [Pedobacter hartonius]SEA75646.1 Carbohydrate-binding family 9 [Pedobacter hartonius]
MLEIPYLQPYSRHSAIEELALRLKVEPWNAITHTPWQKPYPKPEASFAIAHGNDAVFLKYSVEEETLRSTYVHPNDPVYNDSCVEFFIGFEGEPGYYNFEFNCAGTCLAGFGEGRERLLLPAEKILKIRQHSLVSKMTGENLIHWELTLIIPLEVFIHHQLKELSKMNGKGNFFKCGDGLPKPHYLSWTAIAAPEPNFHLSEFFGNLSFMP